jgi:hypothetical protein
MRGMGLQTKDRQVPTILATNADHFATNCHDESSARRRLGEYVGQRFALQDDVPARTRTTRVDAHTAFINRSEDRSSSAHTHCSPYAL